MDGTNEDHPAFAELRANLEARGLWSCVKIDASIVRGLAYYTGTVFEVFDLKHGLRAVAGGGRYDKLCALMSDGSVDMPSAGFAMGDVVLGISTSGTSKNVLLGLEAANKCGCVTIAFTGEKGADCAAEATLSFKAPSAITARVQECHLLIGHLLCDVAEQAFAE
jgi:histidyl-tRNA synthetase